MGGRISAGGITFPDLCQADFPPKTTHSCRSYYIYDLVIFSDDSRNKKKGSHAKSPEPDPSSLPCCPLRNQPPLSPLPPSSSSNRKAAPAMMVPSSFAPLLLGSSEVRIFTGGGVPRIRREGGGTRDQTKKNTATQRDVSPSLRFDEKKIVR